MTIQHDTYRVTWSPEDDEHVGPCAGFASLSWLAKTPEAALKGIQKVVGKKRGQARIERGCVAYPGFNEKPVINQSETS